MVISFLKQAGLAAQCVYFVQNNARSDVFPGPFLQPPHPLGKSLFGFGPVNIPDLFAYVVKLCPPVFAPVTDADKGVQKTQDDYNLWKESEPCELGSRPAIGIDGFWVDNQGSSVGLRV